ncbi:hypothetical protein CK203_090441 [Vitis vinifera]|uniref:Uncharacterized protein n=1 Tax=Vitis vinifera TaxID=29760 RepID=A0A438BVR9_VITVI|nr:hypothetical protein CK203_090441 [Vitis vinifera]
MSSINRCLLNVVHSHAELEESNQKEGPEIEDARSTIAEVDNFFQTTEG